MAVIEGITDFGRESVERLLGPFAFAAELREIGEFGYITELQVRGVEVGEDPGCFVLGQDRMDRGLVAVRLDRTGFREVLGLDALASGFWAG